MTRLAGLLPLLTARLKPGEHNVRLREQLRYRGCDVWEPLGKTRSRRTRNPLKTRSRRTRNPLNRGAGGDGEAAVARDACLLLHVSPVNLPAPTRAGSPGIMRGKRLEALAPHCDGMSLGDMSTDHRDACLCASRRSRQSAALPAPGDAGAGDTGD